MSTEVKSFTIEVISGRPGPCLTINDVRVAGPKPWGGGRVIHSFKVDAAKITEALKENASMDARVKELEAILRIVLDEWQRPTHPQSEDGFRVIQKANKTLRGGSNG